MQKALYQHFYNAMMKMCYRYTHDIETAASLYNDAMLKVFSHMENYQDDGKLMAWVKRIVVNTCIDHVRKKLPIQTKELSENEIADSLVENEVFVKMSNSDIRKLIMRLPGHAAVVFNLYVYEGYNHSEIAKLLRIPAGSSRYYLSESRRLLKKMTVNDVHSFNKE